MATTLSVIGPLAGAMTGGTPAPVALIVANMTQLTAGSNVLFDWANTGALVVVVLNSTAAGGTTWEPTIYPTTGGAAGGPNAPLGVAIPLTSMILTTPSTIGAFPFGPFGPSKFNDTNGMCWLTQVGASATTSYIGVYSLPGAAA